MINLRKKIIIPALMVGLTGLINNCATSEGNVMLGEFLMTSEDPADRALGQAMVTYGAMTHEKEVAAMGKSEIKIYVNSKGEEFYGSTVSATGTIHEMWAEHNVMKNGKSGMYIYTKFTVKGNMGFPVMVTAYFSENGRALIDKDGIYTTSTGQVANSCGYITATTMDYYKIDTIFMPYEQLHLSDYVDHRIRFNTRLDDLSENQPRTLTSSKLGSFIVPAK